jgi:hypothetical protein
VASSAQMACPPRQSRPFPAAEMSTSWRIAIKKQEAMAGPRRERLAQETAARKRQSQQTVSRFRKVLRTRRLAGLSRSISLSLLCLEVRTSC